MSKISSPPLKKQKFGGSEGIIISSLVRTLLPFSPTVSIENLPSPPLTQKGKKKKGERIWTDPTTALGQTHNVISNYKLKTLSSTTNYLLKDEKVVMVDLRAEVAEAESSRIRNDLIEEVSQTNEVKTQLNEVSEQLRTEKMLEI